MNASTLSTLRIKRTESMVTMIGLPDVPGSAAALFNAMAQAKVPVTMIVQNAPDAGAASITFAIERENAETALEITRSLVQEIGAVGLMSDDHIARLSVVGSSTLEGVVGLAGEFFSILAEEGINVLAINTTADIISCIIEDTDLDKASKLLAGRFGLALEIVE